MAPIALSLYSRMPVGENIKRHVQTPRPGRPGPLLNSEHGRGSAPERKNLPTRGVMLRHDRTEGWLEILGAVSSDP